MVFVWDQSKSDATKKSRGFDFDFAKRVFDDPEHITGPGNLVGGEERWLTVGTVEGNLVTVCWTQRGEATRIISARPSREEERKAYGEG
jgi:uncharacterized DUF497 family protein